MLINAKASKGVEDAEAAIGDKARASTSGADVRTGGTAAARLKESTSQKVPEDMKSRASEMSQQTKEYLSVKIPQERRDQAIWRMKKMIVEIQGHSDCEYHDTSTK
jgi:hypothetical protein